MVSPTKKGGFPMSVKQISIFLENKPGFLAEVTKVLGQNNIDMRAFSLAESNDFGIARIIVDDVYKTTTVLKDAGYINSVIDVLAVPLPDVPGGLSQVLKILGDAQVNVEYMYAFLGGKIGFEITALPALPGLPCECGTCTGRQWPWPGRAL